MSDNWRFRPWEWLATLGTVGALAACGAPVALLWWVLAPRIRVEATVDGLLLINPQAEEYLGSDLSFLAAGCAGALIATGAVWWLLRRWRGPVMALALALGVLAGGWVTWQVGEELGKAQVRHVVDESHIGDTPRVPIMRLRLTGFLFIPAALASGIYALLAAWSPDAELNRKKEDADA